MKNEVLSKKMLDLYSYVSLRNIVLDIFELFRYLGRTNDKVTIPRITNNYQVRYEQFVPISSSAVENFVLIKLMSETKIEENRKKLFSKITKSLRELNELELKVFHYTFYESKSEYEISKIVNWGYKKVRQIRKSACIKFLSSLNLDNKCLKEDVKVLV